MKTEFRVKHHGNTSEWVIDLTFPTHEDCVDWIRKHGALGVEYIIQKVYIRT